MSDYHVLSLPDIGGEVTDHGIALKAEDIPWVSKQLWAPDAAQGADGKFYLYFPARDQEGIFRIGVAVSDKPEGPFKPDENYIPGSFSIDPASFVDEDGQGYLYFGGLWGGQLQCWTSGKFDASMGGPQEPKGQVPALLPKVAKLSKDMHTFDGEVMDVKIVDDKGELIMADDHDRRFFEVSRTTTYPDHIRLISRSQAAWVHKYNGKYYFSYSTGDTHFLAYGVSDSPLGPYTYRGKILDPVLGWTTHHSIVEHKGKWYLFYHDCSLSKGVDHLRSVKMREIIYDSNGDIKLAQPQVQQ